VRVLEAPLPVGVVMAIAVVTCLLLAAFIAGVGYRFVAPLAAAGLLWTLTYRNCFGMLFHTENLLVLHVIALAVAPAGGGPASTTGYGWPVRLMAALTVATYMLAGIAKLRIAGIGWVDGELLRNQIAVDNLRKAVLGDGIARFAHLVLDHPDALIPFSAMTFVIELGAPLALLHRRAGYAWSLVAWGFHAGVVLLMNILFLYPLSGVAFAPLLPVERVIFAARGILRRVRR
jgi:hypothetical protein